MNAYILSIAAQDRNIQTAGGKGASLAQLSQAGFPVPAGFIISTQAYLDFVAANDLQPGILTLVNKLNIEMPDVVERASQSISGLFSTASLPRQIEAEITQAYHTLFPAADRSVSTPTAVAVRSSATAEDLPGFAFAGQQDTFLNVIGDLDLLEAVQRCWASLWSARAITYRARNGFAPDAVSLAVVVQQMVDAEVSGVLFTANPLTGKRNEIHIDASYGLGEAIVSGQVEPDHYTVDPSNGDITGRRLGAKQVAIHTRPDGGIKSIDRASDGEQALPDASIRVLARMGQHVAAFFGEPQDIEWAWSGGQFFLLQSRPITSLYPLPEESAAKTTAANLRPPDLPFHIYFNFNAIQGVPDPLTPLGIDALRLVFSGILKNFGIQKPVEQVFPEAGCRLFLDFGGVPGDPALQKILLNFLDSVEPVERAILLQLLADGRVPSRRVLTPRLAFRLLRSASPLLLSTALSLLRYRTAREQVIRAGENFVKRVENAVAVMPGTAKADLAACLLSLERDLPGADTVSARAMPLGLLANQLVPVLNGWLTDWLGEPPGAAMPLLRSLPGNVTVEMNLRLWASAQAIRGDELAAEVVSGRPVEELAEQYQQGRLPTTAQRAMARFLQVDGMRGVAEIVLGKPRWQNDPAPIIRTLKSYLQLEDPNLAPDRVFERGAEQAEQLIINDSERIRKTQWGWLRARLFQGIAWRVRELGSLREVPLFYLAKVFALYRKALLQVGSELVKEGQVDTADDIFFIPLAALNEWVQHGSGNLKAIAWQRQDAYRNEYRRRQMPRVLLSSGEAFYAGAPAQESANQLTGMAVSPGVAEGTARVILDPRGARLEPGDILVCPSTDPGWTPLFLTAGGLVMEIGGLMTHGSVVAREFGIPAVVGVRDATTRIRTGQRIQVDGNHGWVTGSQ